MSMLLQSANVVSDARLEMVIPICAIVLGTLGVGLPASVFSIARKWTESRPDLMGAALGGAVVVSIVALLVAGIIILAAMGWLPPPTQWKDAF